MGKANISLYNVQAVIVGINRYLDDSIPRLKFARADAEAIDEVLTSPGLWAIPPDNVTLLLDEQASLNNIRSALGGALRRKADIVYFYFAGHGSLATASVKKPGGDGTEKYLVPVDAEYDDIPNTAISIREIAEFLEWKQARQAMLIFDCSFNGFEGGRTFENPLFPIEFEFTDAYLNELAGEGQAVMVACEANQLALEMSNRKQGLFTYFLLEGLRGKAFPENEGRVLLDDFYEYVYANVTHYAEVFDGNMHPVYAGKLEEDVLIQKYSPQMARKTEELQARAEKLYAMAKRAYERNDLDTVFRAMQNILEIFPEDAKVKKVMAAIERKREEERRKVAMQKAAYSAAPQAAVEPEIKTETEIEPERAAPEMPVVEPPAEPHSPLAENAPEEFVSPPARQEVEYIGSPKTRARSNERPAPAAAEKSPPRRRIFTLLAAVFFTGIFIMVYTPGLNRHENTLLYNSLDKSARTLRTTPALLSVEQAKTMLAEHSFYEKHWNPGGAAYNNRLELGTDDGVVIDFNTLLMWQRSGSAAPMKYQDVRNYLDRLNRQKFAGFSDWRLPTLEEAMSLVEREKQNGDLNIDRLFGAVQRSIWTADDENETRKWTVYFYDGNCYPNDVRYGSFFVRAVR